MRRTLLAAASGLVLLSALASPVASQSAADIVDRMLAEYARRTEGVDNYTLIQDAMGFETVTYHEKEMVDGRPVFRLRQASAGGMETSAGDGSLDDVYMFGSELAERAEYEGRENIDGREVHVLALSDLSDLGLARGMAPDDGDFEPRSGKIFIDAERYAPRRMVFDGELTNEQGVHEVTTTIDMLDYEEVDGMLMPHRTAVSIEGLGAAMDPEMREQFEEMQRQLESMPESQRAMVETMMSAQLEQFESMMAGGDGPVTFEMTVKEVRVNSGPPGD